VAVDADVTRCCCCCCCVQVGTRALQGNMTKLGPKVLPISEQLLFAGENLSCYFVLHNMLRNVSRHRLLSLLLVATCGCQRSLHSWSSSL
jgi:hypothetical protein